MRAPISAPVNLKIENSYVIIIIPMSVRANLITVGKNGCSLVIDVRGFGGSPIPPNLRLRERLRK